MKRLHELYERHHTMPHVAELLDVAPDTARRWLIDAGVELAAPGAPRRLQHAVDIDALRRRRAAGATLRQLAAEFGVSTETIRRCLGDPGS